VAHPVAFFEANPAAGVDEVQSDHAGAFYSLSSTPLPAMWPLAATVVIVIPCVFAVVAVSFARHGKAIEPLDMLAFSVYLFLGETCSNIWYSCGFKSWPRFLCCPDGLLGASHPSALLWHH